MFGQGWTMEHVALAAADLGAWDYDVATGGAIWSERTAELHGMPPRGVAEPLDTFLGRVHADDRPRVVAAIRDAVEHGPDDWRVEYRVAGIEPERWLSSRGRVFRDGAGRAVRMAGVVHDDTARRRAEREESERRRFMRAALDASVFAVVVLDPAGRITYCNQLAATLLGLTPSRLRERTYDAPQWKHTALDGGPWPDEQQPFVRVMKTGEAVFGVEHAIERPDGRRTALRINAQPILDEHGEIRLVVASFEDITARLALEENVRQSQKMEAIGRLAGGVAHDFNNLLTVISAHGELLQRRPELDASMQASLQEIVDATRHAASLTGRLLAFSRRQVVAPAVLDVDATLARAARLLGRLIGEDVELSSDAGAQGACVRLDPVQFEQVLVNLAVNARDAMPGGGRLAFRTRRVTVGTGGDAAATGLRPGEYVQLTVADTGPGVPPDVLPHVFEPFYSTKQAGRGTGLGLSIVYGIVQQAGGVATVSSRPGEGATFDVWLPVVHEPPAPTPATGARGAKGSRESLLVVEDEPGVLAVLRGLLTSEGYRVTTATHPREALARVAEGLEPDLLLTDVIMPGMNGCQLFETIREQRPGLRVLYVSGHAQDVISSTGSLGPGEAFLQKPFHLATLLEVVRTTLAAP